MRYLVMIRRTPTGYSADVPDLPGCIAAGKTVERTRRQITAALELHLDSMRESGEPIPSPSPRIEFAIDNQGAEEFCTWVEVPDVAVVPL